MSSIFENPILLTRPIPKPPLPVFFDKELVPRDQPIMRKRKLAPSPPPLINIPLYDLSQQLRPTNVDTSPVTRIDRVTDTSMSHDGVRMWHVVQYRDGTKIPLMTGKISENQVNTRLHTNTLYTLSYVSRISRRSKSGTKLFKVKYHGFEHEDGKWVSESDFTKM
jgi:hypothetical protein